VSTLPAAVLGALVQVVNLVQAGALAAFFSLALRAPVLLVVDRPEGGGQELASVNRRGHAGRGGVAARILPNGITHRVDLYLNDELVLTLRYRVSR
jgi:hypothetical protein